MNYQYKGRIEDIEKYQARATYIKQGVKGPEQYKYKNYPGGNGTYVTGGEYLGTVLNVKVFVYDLDKSIKFDVYEQILQYTGNKRISPQLMESIGSHKGSKVVLDSMDGKNFSFDISQLLD